MLGCHNTRRVTNTTARGEMRCTRTVVTTTTLPATSTVHSNHMVITQQDAMGPVCQQEVEGTAAVPHLTAATATMEAAATIPMIVEEKSPEEVILRQTPRQPHHLWRPHTALSPCHPSPRRRLFHPQLLLSLTPSPRVGLKLSSRLKTHEYVFSY